ncbi:methyltransferase domain-containing protein [Actinomadura fibrosa]|uniref:Methyltransferase domain-containing protein n=1 Tax=Actinomadura fibrosa TaxID=111802 RepID=A0ABW2XUM9_9ACTN|nr:methyltransferase domain-containing protein [Actinomadura fibrosa]
MPIQEKVLIDALEPFKGFVLSSIIFSMHRHGLDEDFRRGTTLADLVASRGGLDRARVAALVDYLVAAQVVARDSGGRLTLTALGERYGEARPWYEMMIGGYGITFLGLGDHLGEGSPPVPRVGRFVGSGSCGISMHDSIPLVRKLLAGGGRDYRLLVDLGCGSGVYLTELCRDYPEMRAVGIEPDAAAVDAAREWVAAQPTADRVRVEQAGALEWLASATDRPDLAVLAFVIHEVLGQEGEDGVRRLLTQLFEAAPDLDLVIVDIDLQSSDEAAMKHPLAQNYYAAYYLMHPFTEQRLETREWWEALFADCGLEIAASSLTDPAMDSTGMEVGWLLRRRAA